MASFYLKTGEISSPISKILTKIVKKKEELYETVEVLQKAKDDIIAETKALSQAQKDFYDEQLKYRNVSQQLRDSLQEKTDIAVKKSEEALNEIKELHLILEQIQTRQEEIDADRKSQKVNELRQDLINAYHYFTSVERNPKQEWNEMEAHAFGVCSEITKDMAVMILLTELFNQQ